MESMGWVVFFVTGTTVLVSLLAVLARKLVGLRVGFARAALAGVTGVFTQALLGSHLIFAGPRVVWIALQLAVGVLVAMGFLALAEAIVPSGSLSTVSVLRSLRERIARIGRYLQIIGLATRRGLLPRLSGRRNDPRHLAHQLRLALEEGGVTFVKLGQALATRPDLIGAPAAGELSRLHDRVSPVTWDSARSVLTAELARAPELVFDTITTEPVASAAIAQVHRATLASGQVVAVKVQRPGIQAVVERDLDIMRRLSALLERRASWARRIGVRELVNGFATALREELDFRTEARNIAAVRSATQARGDDSVALPVVHPALSTRRVLVLDWIDGVPLGSADAVIEAGGFDRAGLSDALLASIMRQIIVDGVFHTDPHPGNVLLRPDGTLALLDFGSVGRLDAGLRSSLQHLLIAVNAGDPAALEDALLELVQRPADIDQHRLERALGHFMASNLSHGAAADMTVFTELLTLAADFELTVPGEVAAVFRSLMTLDGTLRRLTEEFNLVEAVKTSMTGSISDGFGGQSLRQVAAGEALSLLPIVRRFPRRASRIVGALERGDLTIQVRMLADERDRKTISGLLGTALTAFLGGVTGIMAVLMLGTAGGPAVAESVTLYQVIGYYLLVVSAVLILRALICIGRSRV